MAAPIRRVLPEEVAFPVGEEAEVPVRPVGEAEAAFLVGEEAAEPTLLEAQGALERQRHPLCQEQVEQVEQAAGWSQTRQTSDHDAIRREHRSSTASRN